MTALAAGKATKEGDFGAEVTKTALAAGEATKEGDFGAEVIMISALAAGEATKEGDFGAEVIMTALAAGEATKEVFFFETPVYLQSVYYIRSANWCEDWVLWFGEGHSLVPFRSY
jgi:hypothetical protein